MPPKPVTAPIIRVSNLNKTGPTPFLIEPDAASRVALAEEMNALAVKKLRFAGDITPYGRDGWQLQGQLGATTVQACIATLEPVTTRIDTEVSRVFVPLHRIETPDPGSETEIPADEELDELGEDIPLGAIMAEALSLALPTYPRKDGVDPTSAQFSAEGVAPMTEEQTRPFAGLASLREKMQKDGEEG